MQYTDTQLKQALARMLPEVIGVSDTGWLYYWQKFDNTKHYGDCIRDTELLHLCWLVEETLTEAQVVSYYSELCNLLGDGNGLPQWTKVHSTWQQRTIALAKVKGIEIC